MIFPPFLHLTPPPPEKKKKFKKIIIKIITTTIPFLYTLAAHKQSQLSASQGLPSVSTDLLTLRLSVE